MAEASKLTEDELVIARVYPNPHSMTIFACSVNSFKALTSEIGPNMALDTIRPYMHMAGKWYAGMALQRFGQQKSDLEAVALPYYWIHSGTSNGHINPMDIREGKAIIVLHACPTMVVGAPPEICVAMSHFLSEGLCLAINPSYEYVFTHHLANGDNCCRYVVKKKSERFSLDQLGVLEKSMPLDLSQAERDMLTEGVAFGTLGIFTMASVDTIGSERLLRTALPGARETGLALGQRLMNEVKGRIELPMIGGKLDCICCPINQTESSLTVTESGIEKNIVECPFKHLLPPGWPSNGPLPEVCMQLEAVLKGACEAMNPDYEFAFDRMISKGDSTCHWVVRKKAVEVASQQEPTQDDSLGY
jgi:hypothetical protein